MKRRYYQRGQLIEVEQLDNVVAVNGPTSRGSADDQFGRSAREAVRDAVPEVDEAALDAFADADWHIVTPNAGTRESVDRGDTPRRRRAGRHRRGRRRAAASASPPTCSTCSWWPRLSEQEAEQALGEAGLVVVNKLHFAPNLYEVRTQRGDALDASLALHDDPRFVFAEPSLHRAHPAALHPVRPRATASSGSGATPAPPAAPPAPTSTSNRPGTTPSAPASGSP